MQGDGFPVPYSGSCRVGGGWHFNLQDGAPTQQIPVFPVPLQFPWCPNLTSLICLRILSWGWNPDSSQECICFNFSILLKEQGRAGLKHRVR